MEQEEYQEIRQWLIDRYGEPQTPKHEEQFDMMIEVLIDYNNSKLKDIQ